MNFLTGYRANVETISLLSQPHAEGVLRDFASLKAAYQNYTASIQPDLPKSRSEDIEFNNDPRDLEKFAAAFNEESTLRDIACSIQTGDFKDAPEKLRRMEEGYRAIQARHPELGLLLKLTLNTIFALPSAEAGGGSASSGVGVLWANPRATWTEVDIIEFFVHEMTHNLVFLDERRFTHYMDLKMAIAKENWAQSAVLGRLRPIDKAFHSLVVATEILLFRENCTGHDDRYRVHPPSSVLRESSLRCAESLMSLERRDQLYRPRLVELVRRSRETLESLKVPVAKTSVLQPA